MSDELLSCGICRFDSWPFANCPEHGEGTPGWEDSQNRRIQQQLSVNQINRETVAPPPTPTDQLLAEAPLGTSRWRHLDKRLAEMIQNESDAKELLIEACNHAKLTQNLGLQRRIEKWLEKVGIL